MRYTYDKGVVKRFQKIRTKTLSLSTAFVLTLTSLSGAAPLLFVQKAFAAVSNHVVINEVMPNPSSGNQWVELYNPTNASVDISNWRIYGKSDSAATYSQFNTVLPAGTQVASHQFYVINENETALNSTQPDNVYLYSGTASNSSNQVDKLSYSVTTQDASTGLTTDGDAAAAQVFAAPTKGSPNDPTASPVEDTTTSTYYSTIQAAVDNANINDTVTVAAGTYKENVTVNKAMTITGAGAANTKIVATTGLASPLTFNTSGATVSGFTLTHNYTTTELSAWSDSVINNSGVTFGQNTSGNTLSNSTVSLSRNGVYLNNSSANITNDTITDNRTGINLTNDVDGTSITGSTISENWTLGLVFYSQGGATDFSTVSVTGNTFDQNWYTEIEVKDAGSSTGTFDVHNNTFSDSPITYSTAPASDTSLNEPGFAAQKPVELGGTATKPTANYPTLRIYNSPSVTLIPRDTTAPVVTVNPAAGSLLHSTVTFNITVTDDNLNPNAPKTWVYLYNNATSKSEGANVDLTSGHGTFTVNTASLVDGAYTLDVGRLADAAGNYSGKGDTYFNGYVIDNSAPTGLANSSPSNDAFTTTSGLANIDWTDATDPHGPVTYYYESSNSSTLNTDGSFTSPAYQSGALTSSQISTQNTSAGVYYWHVRAVDSLGNSTPWTSPWKITVDNSKPTVAFVDPGTPAANSYVNGNFDVSYTAHDNAELKSVDVSLFDTDSAHPNHWVATCYSNTTETGTDDSGTCTVKLPANLPDGAYYVQVGAQDQALNWSVNATRNINVQRNMPAKPTGLHAKFQYDGSDVSNGSYLNVTTKSGGNNLELLWDSPSDWVTGYHIMAIYPDDSTDTSYQGPNTNAWLVSNGFGQHGNGKYTYKVIAVNPNGTTTSDETFTLYYDTQSPTASFTKTPPLVVNGNFHVKGAASDNVGLSGVFFDVRDASGWAAGCADTPKLAYNSDKTSAKISCNIDTSNLVDGQTYTLRIHAGDNAGYGGGQEQQLTIDRTAPNVQIKSPGNGVFISGTTKLKGAVSDANPDSYSWIVKDSTGEVVASDRNVKQATVDPLSWNTSKVADGTYTIYLRATDQAGNKSDTSVTVNVDNAKPKIHIKPQTNSLASNTAAFTIKGTASDDGSGLKNSKVTIKLTGATGAIFQYKVAVNSNSKWKLTIPANTLADGLVQVMATARDNQGNENQATETFTVDSTAPLVTANNYSGTNTTPILTGTVDDPNATVTIAIDGNTTQSTVNNGDGTWTFVVPAALTVNDHSIVVTASDSAGNTNTGTATATIKPVIPLTVGNSATPTPKIFTSNLVSVASSVGSTPQVLGASTTQPTSTTSGHVLGDKTSNPKSSPDTKNFSDAAAKKATNFLGLAWYWWILIIAIAAALLYSIFRKAGTDDKTPANNK